MGADKVLIDSFRELYDSQGANYADALSKPLATAAANIAVRMEKLREEIDDHVSLYPPEADVTDVPVDFVSDTLRPALSAERDSYSQYSEQFVKAKSSEDKNKARSLMDQSLNKVNSLNADIKAYKSFKAEGIFDADNNLMSKQAFLGKQGEKTEEIFGVFTGKTSLTIDEKTKRLGFFSEKENRFVPVNEFSKFLPPQKAEEQATTLNQILEGASKGQVFNSPEAIEVSVRQFEASLGKGNRKENIKSIAFDDLQVPGYSLIDLNNPEFSNLLDELDSDNENDRIKAEESLKQTIMGNVRNLITERTNIYYENQTAQAQQEVDLQTKALGQRQKNQLKLNKQFNFKAAYDDPMYARKFLITNNPNYKLKGTEEAGIGESIADITKEKGFNANRSRMRELIKLTNEDYDITLSEGKVVVGPKVLITEDEKGKALNEPYNEVQEELSFKSLEDFSDYIQRQLNLV
jgi:hypothetical protein